MISTNVFISASLALVSVCLFCAVRGIKLNRLEYQMI